MQQANQKTRERSFSHQSNARKVGSQQQQQNLMNQPSNKPSGISPIPTNNLQPFQTNIERPSSNRNEPSSRQIGQQLQQSKVTQLYAPQGQQQESMQQKIKDSPYYSSIGQRPQTTDRMRNQIMNLQQAYNIKPQTAQNSHRIDKNQQDDPLRYSTPLQKKGSQIQAIHTSIGQNTQQQGSQQFQSSSNNFYQLGKSIGSQQAYISKGKLNQSNPNEIKFPQFSTPQPTIKELSKSQQPQQHYISTQYSSQQYSIQQAKLKQPQQIMQNYLGTSEKEKQGHTGQSQTKAKRGLEVSKKIDFSTEENIDNFLMMPGKGECIQSSSSSEQSSKLESPNYGNYQREKLSNDQLKQNTKQQSSSVSQSKTILQNQSQQQSSKQQKLSVQSNQRGDSNINSLKQQQGDITNSQYSRPKSPSNEIHKQSKAHSSQPKKLAETSDNFYKPSKSPYEKQASQTLKNFYISKSKPQEKIAGSRKRIYSTNQSEESQNRQGSNTSYQQKQSTSYSRGPQDLYQNIDISLNPSDIRKSKLSNSNSGELQNNQNEREERKEDFHSSVVDYNFDFVQFQNMQRPPCRKKLNTFNVEGIGASKGPIKPRHDIQVGETAQNPLRPPSRHKLPPKNLGLGFSDSEESGEDIPVKEMFQKTQDERNELIFSHDTSLLRPKKLSDQGNLDQFIPPSNEPISKTFNLNDERSLQSREVYQARPKSSRTNRSKSHISKQGTETQIPSDPLFDEDLLVEKSKDKRFSLNNYANNQDYNSDDLLSDSSDEQEKIQSEQQNPKSFSIMNKRLQGSDIVIKHNVAQKKSNLEKIQLPFDTKLGVEFIGLFANYQDNDTISNMQTPQRDQLKPLSNEQIFRQQQQLQQQQRQKDIFSTPSPHSVQQQGYEFEQQKQDEQEDNNNQIDDFEEQEQKFNRY